VSSRPLRTLGFVDRVMAQVAEEPQPTAARVFLRSVAGLRFRDAAAALATAGHLAFGRSVAVPAPVRAQSLVLLLLFTVVVGSGGALAAAGAIRVFEDRSVPPPVEQPLPLPQVSPDPPPDVTPSPDASPPSSPARDSAEPADAGRNEPTPAARKGDESRQDGPTREQDRGGGGEPRQSGGKSGQPDRDGDQDRSGGTADDRAGDGGGRATPGAPEPAASGGPVKRDKTPLPDREQDTRREP
jgi:hypothetical protein